MALTAALDVWKCSVRAGRPEQETGTLARLVAAERADGNRGRGAPGQIARRRA